ncbi:MAG: ATP phosphoribosyltransferase [Chloroflexota bacterium]
MNNEIKIALPKGRLLAQTASLLEKAGWGLDGYTKEMPLYRLKSRQFPGLLSKIFQEKDIPIQVAVGNYDFGICGLDWIEELLVKYPSSALVKLRDLGYGDSSLFVVASRSGSIPTLKTIPAKESLLRIASEYPNLAESFALNLRAKRFSIFPVWGAAEGYPPENADLALISRKTDEKINHELVPLTRLFDCTACLIANRNSWEKKDLSHILGSIEAVLPIQDTRKTATRQNVFVETTRASKSANLPAMDKNLVRLALPDGHQQEPTAQLLSRAGIKLDDYPSKTGSCRPNVNLDGVTIKVIRPQDMPLQVANNNFDIAITGKDWLREHLYQFPSSPVTELLDLKSGKVRIVAVVSNELPANDIYSLRQVYTEKSAPIRIASEYTNIADRYAQDNHLGKYRVLPTWGATEAFLPEDADLLIENTETGRTIARHNLKIIDTLFESTGCIIGNKDSLSNRAKSKIIKSIIEKLRTAVEDTQSESH